MMAAGLKHIPWCPMSSVKCLLTVVNLLIATLNESGADTMASFNSTTKVIGKFGKGLLDGCARTYHDPRKPYGCRTWAPCLPAKASPPISKFDGEQAQVVLPRLLVDRLLAMSTLCKKSGSRDCMFWL
jgi:hypothetical protein